MTIQANDFVWYKNKKYTLIDCEKEKELIDSADFNLEDMDGVCTSCWRGYMAEYFIDDDELYGIKEIWVPCDDGKKLSLGIESSDKKKLNYSGSIIVALNEDGASGCADFTDDFLYFDEAYEMYFEEGVLLEIISLKAAIDEYQSYLSQRDQDNSFNDITDSFSYESELRKQIKAKSLKYKYKNYKWNRSKRKG